MALTLTEALKLSTTSSQQGVIETVVKGIARALAAAVHRHGGNALTYNRDERHGQRRVLRRGRTWSESTRSPRSARR